MSSRVPPLSTDYLLRLATLADRPALERLIADSARGLSAADYTPEQIEGALSGAFGVDTQLIDDGTYYAVERRTVDPHSTPPLESQTPLTACGGWSKRRTLFGGDRHAARDAGLLDPSTEAARIRAFFVHPAHARRGLGTLLLERCERDARAEGFTRLELMATLPGVRLYTARGFVAGEPVEHALAPGRTIGFVPMHKRLG